MDSAQLNKNRWDLISFGLMSLAFIIYITPLSTIVQRLWQQFLPNLTKFETSTTTETPSLFTGDFKATPKPGEKIAGYLVTSGWGDRDTGIPGASTFHEGTDVSMDIGTPIKAIGKRGEKVKVTCAQDTGGGGLYASYKTSWGIGFDYLHLSKCEPGEYPDGSVIALSGNSGISSGPHLHLTQRDTTGKKVPPERGYVHWAIAGDKP